MPSHIGALGVTSQRLRSAAVTRREAEVLFLVADRYRNAEIADELSISKRTVESHLAALLRKLGAADRAQLMKIGLDCTDSRAGGRARHFNRPRRMAAILVDNGNLRRAAAVLCEQSQRRCASSTDHLRRSRELLDHARALVGEQSGADIGRAPALGGPR